VFMCVHGACVRECVCMMCVCDSVHGVCMQDVCATVCVCVSPV
jgi:hypothetical protein